MGQYAESSPSAALAPWVECYWSITATDAAPGVDRILPDGCADVIVDLGASPHAFVVGTMSTALLTPRAGRVEMFGIRFRPGAAFPFLGVPLREITDRRVALDELWGARTEQLIDAVIHGHVERVLTPPRVAREDEIVPSAVALFRQARGGVAVRDVAAALGLGARRLNRAFDRCVGLSPKGFARVMRFREAYQQVQRGAALPWTRLAGDAGYADQPHLIREFQALAGLTPAQYAAERGVRFVQYGEKSEE
jgi:AraC-like DNA-binding protein